MLNAVVDMMHCTLYTREYITNNKFVRVAFDLNNMAYIWSLDQKLLHLELKSSLLLLSEETFKHLSIPSVAYKIVAERRWSHLLTSWGFHSIVIK